MARLSLSLLGPLRAELDGVPIVGFGYDKHYIYSLGFPNMGNGWCNGKTAQPSKGRNWADWDPVVGTTIKGMLTERKSDSSWLGTCRPSEKRTIALRAASLAAAAPRLFITEN